MEGYLGLFASAFLAATVLPFSSELVLVGLMLAEDYNSFILWAVASLGNVAGACVNWGVGRFCINWKDRNWFPVKQAQLDSAEKWFSRYGIWSLLFSWVPVVGDPLTFLSGILRVNFRLFVILVTIGKAGRYGVLIFVSNGIFNI
ncbi:MAG: YqaA family protein [Pseudomonadota bacterium]|nr:YqaA family protein [Pseudomonadota bacterium]|tara:strand:- start:45 stop:479 length:435 start_codon:yes stop_codon:yes gene_type:complete